MRGVTRMCAALAAAVVSVGLAAGPAFAGSPHFIKNLTSASSSGFDLVVKFKEAGLESGSVETITLSAHFDAVFQCINGGKHNPNAANKSEESGDASVSGQFTADKNGNVNGSLTLAAPSTDTNTLECPSGQTEQLSVITWSSVHLDDETSGASLDLPGTFTFGSLVQ